MSSFAGVSVLADGELCPATASTVGTSAVCGYHLLVVHDYPRTKQEAPTGDSISSRPFMVGGHCWIINYYPNGEDSDCADFISLELSCLQDDANKKQQHVVEAKVVFSFIDQVEMQNPVYIAQAETYSFNGFSRARRKFMTRQALEQSSLHLKDDSFTIRCDIMVSSSCNPKDDDATKALLPHMCQHFEHLLQTEVGADVRFEVGGETMAAHRCVLAARSRVFMSQLFGPMKEGTTKAAVIRIKDMDASVFRALLNFIYTDTFPAMEHDDSMEEDETSQITEQGQEKETTLSEARMWLQWLQNLLVAADRYDVQRLKCICESELSEHICVSSVMSTLALAEQHHCHGLKEACFKFIQVQSPSCLQTLMSSNGWDHVFDTYPSVLKELIAKLASNHRN
ncbi:BTB/POZ and MATH domain-containing protein 1-like [Triticum dicoccoides]|uniref:BTB/POZ and MATH domain-containing protein 1-like n=1 Tax=Triticum dicoccoides TaxID=85692 RepID=UPI000E7A1352|nr:BTB/POZ and MATH domain-containing protein 1-like [Triticum dicoccoides]